MADGDEHAVTGQVADHAALQVLQPHAGDARRVLGPQHLFHRAVPHHLDLRVGEQPLLQDLLRAQLVAAVHQGDLGGEVGEKQGLFDRRIAAADHGHRLAAVEEAVAGGAGGDAKTLELGLALQAQPLGLGAGGDDQGLGQPHRAAVADQAERPGGQIGGDDDVLDHLGADVLGLGLHLLHQPGALDHLGEARVVFDVGGDGQLAAGGQAADQHRVQQGAGGIDGGGVAGGAGADDQAANGTRIGHVGLCRGRFQGQYVGRPPAKGECRGVRSMTCRRIAPLSLSPPTAAPRDQASPR